MIVYRELGFGYAKLIQQNSPVSNMCIGTRIRPFSCRGVTLESTVRVSQHLRLISRSLFTNLLLQPCDFVTKGVNILLKAKRKTQ